MWVPPACPAPGKDERVMVSTSKALKPGAIGSPPWAIQGLGNISRNWSPEPCGRQSTWKDRLSYANSGTCHAPCLPSTLHAAAIHGAPSLVPPGWSPQASSSSKKLALYLPHSAVPGWLAGSLGLQAFPVEREKENLPAVAAAPAPNFLSSPLELSCTRDEEIVDLRPQRPPQENQCLEAGQAAWKSVPLIPK